MEFASKVKFFIGAVRGPGTIRTAMVGVDYVFHAAQIKEVPSCEFFLWNAVKTNVLGMIMFCRQH
jgi:UDP-glucose 4-epimerase